MNVRKYGRSKSRKSSGRDPRPLHLKIRVILTAPATAEQARLLLHRAVETGIVPPGIEIRWIDWAKGGHGRGTSGRMTSHMRKALREFYGAITGADTRFEKVR
jgi:hypothetical protein